MEARNCPHCGLLHESADQLTRHVAKSARCLSLRHQGEGGREGPIDPQGARRTQMGNHRREDSLRALLLPVNTNLLQVTGGGGRGSGTAGGRRGGKDPYALRIAGATGGRREEGGGGEGAKTSGPSQAVK